MKAAKIIWNVSSYNGKKQTPYILNVQIACNGPPLEANFVSASREILHLSQNPNYYFRVHTGTHLDLILRQMNPAYSSTPYDIYNPPIYVFKVIFPPGFPTKRLHQFPYSGM